MLGQLGYVGAGAPAWRISGDAVRMSPLITHTRYAIPTLANGERARVVLLSGSLGRNCLVQFGDSTVDATNTGHMWSLSKGYYPFNVSGMTHLSILDESGTATIGHMVALDSWTLVPGALRFAGNATEYTGIANTFTTEMVIPNDSTGKRAKYVYIWGEGPAALIYRPGFTGQSIHLSGYGLQGKSGYPTILDVTGYTHVLAARVSAGVDNINIAPLEF